MGLIQLQFKGDCLTIIREARGVGVGNKDVRPIIFDIQHLLHNHLEASISFAPKECNRVAHALAKLACSLLTKTVWMETYPEQVVSYVPKDVSGSARLNE